MSSDEPQTAHCFSEDSEAVARRELAVNADLRDDGWRQRRFWCLVIFTLALAVRALHLWQLSATPVLNCTIGDAEAYDQWGREIAAGNWLGDRVFYQAPLYPYFLATIYATLGDELGIVRKCQAVIGSLSCVLLTLAAWRLHSKWAGILAGSIMACYAPIIFHDALLQKSVLDTFFVCLAIWLLSRLIYGSQRRNWLWLGLTLGALALTRENALILIPVILLWLCLRDADWRAAIRTVFRTYAWLRPPVIHAAVVARYPLGRRAAEASLLFAGLTAVLLPVALRNRFVGGEFHLTTSQLGPNLYIGNNPQADGTYRPLTFGHGHANYERSDAEQLAEAAMGRSLTPAEVSSYYVRQVVRYIRSEPANWLALMGRKFLLTWNAVELVDSEDQYTYADWSWPLRLTNPVFHFGFVVPLAVWGVCTTWSRRNTLWVFYLILAALAAGVVIFFVFARYRLPMAPLLILFAAAGLTSTRGFLRTRSRLAIAGCFIAVVVSVVLCNLPLISKTEMRATTLNNLGNELAKRGEIHQAIDFYERALAVQPDCSLAHNNLGVVLARQGRTAEATAHYERALALQPDYANARKNLDRAKLNSP